MLRPIDPIWFGQHAYRAPFLQLITGGILLEFPLNIILISLITALCIGVQIFRVRWHSNVLKHWRHETRINYKLQTAIRSRHYLARAFVYTR